MPFDSGSTTYTPTSGAETAVAGQTIQSAVWNLINGDYADALTMLNAQYSSINTNRNVLNANGGCEIWQRGAGASSSIAVAASTTTGQYTADRWYLATNANQACVVSAQTGLVSQSLKAARAQRNSGQTGTGVLTFGYPLDANEISRMLGKTVYFSCLAQAGANWSPTSGTLTVKLFCGTAAATKQVNGYTGSTTAFTITSNLTAGGAAVAISGSSSAVIPTTTLQAELQFTWTPVGTAGTNDYVDIDDVSLEIDTSSTTWTPMNYDRLDFYSMLHLCRNTFQKTFKYATAPAQSLSATVGAFGISPSTNGFPNIYWQFSPKMRAEAPTITLYNPGGSNANWRDTTAGADVNATVDTSSQSNQGVFITGATATATSVPHILYISAIADAGI